MVRFAFISLAVSCALALTSVFSAFTEAIVLVRERVEGYVDWGLRLVGDLFKPDPLALSGPPLWLEPPGGQPLAPALLNGMRHEAGMRPAPG